MAPRAATGLLCCLLPLCCALRRPTCDQDQCVNLPVPYLQYDAVSDELLFAVAGWLTDKVATITTSLRSAGKVSKDVKSSAA